MFKNNAELIKVCEVYDIKLCLASMRLTDTLILLPLRYDGQNIASARQKKSAHSTVRQRHFLRRFNHHRAKLGHAVIGNT